VHQLCEAGFRRLKRRDAAAALDGEVHAAAASVPVRPPARDPAGVWT
jgi:hypothetical protein